MFDRMILYGFVIFVLVMGISAIVAQAGTERNAFYRDKMVPGTQVPCCTKKDCVPLSAWRQNVDGEYEIYLPHGYWYKPKQTVVRVDHTPDGRAHACYHERSRAAYEQVKVTVFCVWIPVPTT